MTTEMVRMRVFEVAWVKQQDNELQVAGRAYETIRVGDTLLACTSDDTNTDCADFSVLKIKIYNREIEQIDPVFAGLLILVGDAEEILSRSKYLYSSIS